MSASLLPPNSTPIERAISQTSAPDLGDDAEIIRRLWDPARCPVPLLPWLAWALSVENWRDDWTEDAKRAIIADSIMLHRRKGTPWALRRALAPIGLTVDIIDQQMQRAAYAGLGALRIDGGWSLDGVQKIRPMELYANLPQIQHWAQFIVRINLADATQAENFELVRPLVAEWKPARAWPLFLFWLSFVLDAPTLTTSSLLLDKRIPQRYPWCGRVIGDAADVRWTLGRDGTAVTLPQPFGSFRVGERRGGLSAWRLSGCRITSAAAMQSTATAPAYRLPHLAESDRRLDGTWRVGGRGLDTDSHAGVQAAAEIAAAHVVEITHHETIRLDYPATPEKLGGRARLASWRRLDGAWRVGEATRRRPFGFVLRRDRSVLAESAATLAMRSECCATPARLSGRLDGTWRVGGPAVPLFDMTIIKEPL